MLMCKTMKEETGITLSLLALYAKSPEIPQVPYILQLCPVELPSDPKAPPMWEVNSQELWKQNFQIIFLVKRHKTLSFVFF